MFPRQQRVRRLAIMPVGAIRASTTMSITATTGSITATGHITSSTFNMTANAAQLIWVRLLISTDPLPWSSQLIRADARSGCYRDSKRIHHSVRRINHLYGNDFQLQVNLTATTGSLSLGTVTVHPRQLAAGPREWRDYHQHVPQQNFYYRRIDRKVRRILGPSDQ